MTHRPVSEVELLMHTFTNSLLCSKQIQNIIKAYIYIDNVLNSLMHFYFQQC